MVALIEQEGNEKAKKSSEGKEKVKAEKSHLEQTKAVVSFSSSQLLI